MTASQVSEIFAQSEDGETLQKLRLFVEATGVGEVGNDDAVSDFHILDTVPYLDYDTDRLVAQGVRDLGASEDAVVYVQITSADGACRDSNDRVVVVDDLGAGNPLDGHFEGLAFPEDGLHGLLAMIMVVTVVVVIWCGTVRCHGVDGSLWNLGVLQLSGCVMWYGGRAMRVVCWYCSRHRGQLSIYMTGRCILPRITGIEVPSKPLSNAGGKA